jgi:hypothetical protein
VPAIAFELVALPDTRPRMCPCRVGTPPYVKTFMELGEWGDLYLCSSCVRALVKTYALVPESDYLDALEQHELAAARIAQLDAELVASSRRVAELESQLGSAELDGLRDTVAAIKREADRLARENAELRKGETASVIRDAIADIRAAAGAPVNTKSSRH